MSQEMMVCTGCGKEMHKRAGTCPHCGKRVSWLTFWKNQSVFVKALGILAIIITLILTIMLI
jgi:predicted ATP-dependent serine protease